MKTALKLAEHGFVPKKFLRRGIRGLIEHRLEEQEKIFRKSREDALEEWIAHMRTSEIALVPESANEQHYEVPPRFFELVLGPRLKYSSAYFETPETELRRAEEDMLALTSERAELAHGQRILELGCGWGSLTLWMAERFPDNEIVAVSNSTPQRKHIERRLAERGLTNVTIVTCDMNDFAPEGTFDRIVSVEMFEHMRNWERLLGRVRAWLNPDGRVFLHVFAHEKYAYAFEVRDPSDWMSQYFFTGGMMPCTDLLEHLDTPFRVEQRWDVNGEHYARTSEHWVKNLEQHRREIVQLFGATYGPENAKLWYHRWRIFFLSCAELFGFGGGSEWLVSHVRLAPKSVQ